MNWNKNHIVNIVKDMAEENTFACRALFKISDIIFTKSVPTLAVSISSKPVLMINKSFLDKHAISENDVKAVLLHEFLHVILRHTEKFKYNTPLLNIALDAIINSIIHRTYGEMYSDFFCRFYDWDINGITSLLRPRAENSSWSGIHDKIYSGKFAADDLYELLQYLLHNGILKGMEQLIFIGNHDFASGSVSPENEKLLNQILSKMDGTGIWNKPGERGSNDRSNSEEIKIAKYKIDKWKRSVFSILKKCMEEDEKKKNTAGESIVMMPVLSNNDRRALSVASWSGLIPFTKNIFSENTTSETVNIYLDVSGSMSQEIDQIVSLLNHFRNNIRTPLWVFSNEVEKAAFKNGNIVYKSTGGTSISCVFDHIRVNRFRKNIIVTDGFTETITAEMIKSICLEKLWVIVSANGNAAEFNRHHIKYTQLKKI